MRMQPHSLLQMLTNLHAQLTSAEPVTWTSFASISNVVPPPSLGVELLVPLFLDKEVERLQKAPRSAGLPVGTVPTITHNPRPTVSPVSPVEILCVLEHFANG